MTDFRQDKKEKTRIIKLLIARWIRKQETAEKARILLSKNPQIKIRRSLIQKIGD